VGHNKKEKEVRERERKGEEKDNEIGEIMTLSEQCLA
jgi:hypothetical protein